MASIELTARLNIDTVLSGESLPVVVSVKNAGDSAVEVHNAEMENPFRYELISTEKDGQQYSFSQADAELAYNPQPREKIMPMMAPLAPGQQFDYETDLARLITENLPAGPYHLVVHYALAALTVSSKPLPLTIRMPKSVGNTNMVNNAKDLVVTTFVQDMGDKGHWLMQRESKPGNPGMGILYRRLKLDAAPQATALACETAGDRLGGSWFAWLEGDRIGAGWGWEKVLMGDIAPVPVGLSDVRLIDAGLRLDGPHAMFLAAGRGTDNQAYIKAFIYTFVPKPKPGSPPKKPVAPPEHNPETMTFPLGPHQPAQIMARYVYQPDRKHIQIVWSEADQGRTRIYQQTLNPADPSAGNPPKLLMENDQPLAAMALEPISEQPDGAVDLLFGPAGSDRTMTYVRMPLNSDKSSEQWTFEARGIVPLDKPGDVDPLVEQWALSNVPSDGTPVLAKVQDRIALIQVATPGGWTEVAAEAQQADHLQVSALYRPDRYNSMLWGFWTDPKRGIVYQRLD